MAYLSSPASELDYGVVRVGNNISVLDGVISLEQDLSPDSSVQFGNVTVTNNLTAAGNLVVTSVTPTAGPGVAIANLISNGYAASFRINNTGVLSLTAGSGITLSGSTGNITISSYGADLINVIGVTGNYTATLTDEYIGVSSAAAVTISLPAGVDGRVYTIKDEYGQGSGKITVQPASGELVDGKPNYVISIPNQSVNVVFRAGSWWIV